MNINTFDINWGAEFPVTLNLEFCTPSLCPHDSKVAKFLLSCIVKLQPFLEDGYLTQNFQNPSETSEAGKAGNIALVYIYMEGAGDLVFFFFP